MRNNSRSRLFYEHYEVLLHKKAVLGIIVEMEVERTEGLPAAVLKDITDFISRLENDPFDVNTLINYGVTTEEVAGRLSAIFI